MGEYDAYWDQAARMLKQLVDTMPPADVESLERDQLKFLAAYQPAEGQWDERQHRLRDSLVRGVGEKQFRSIWETYRETYRNTK